MAVFAKPCPFCSSRDIRVIESRTARMYFCSCSSCGATGPDTKEYGLCIRCWNVRINPDSGESDDV